MVDFCPCDRTRSPGAGSADLDLPVQLQHAVPGHFWAEGADFAVLYSPINSEPVTVQ